MEISRDYLFHGKELHIDHVVSLIESDPSKTREVMEFIGDEMRKEEELKEKLEDLKEDYHHKKHELYKEYGMEHLID
jgi:GrpB-like predicted nucleotidyltransferase (UPF0157 family)